MSVYHVVPRGRRIAVYDEHGRCVELLPAATPRQEIAAMARAAERDGRWPPPQTVRTQCYDTDRDQWSVQDWADVDA